MSGHFNWLFSGGLRVGKLTSDMFTPDELAALRQLKSSQIVDARVKNAGAFGHDYFHSNPAVSSDLVLIMRYRHLIAGAENGRPPQSDPQGFWYITDSYPENRKP